MSKLEIIQLIAIAILTVAFAIYLGVKAFKNKWIQQLTETIEKAIKTAESTGATGSAKKAFVLQKVEEKCGELGIPYHLLANLIGKLVDTIVHNYNVLSK